MRGFENKDLNWIHLKGSSDFDYPIDYSLAVLGASREEGRIDFLGKWEPDSYCHYHRHIAQTTTLVLEGEHHLEETGQGESGHKVRPAGDYADKPAGDLHMEYAGPNGSLVLFSMHTADGRLFEIVDKSENVLAVVTLDDLASGRLPV